MTSTTIRYSTLPENSQSISLSSSSSAYPPPSDDHRDSPGAYRYDPKTYDPSVPDSDPRSPRYEPPHLRHRPGDTFEIGGKPHDPDDPGPFGVPGWFQDQRTGRHRRGELPDPLPSGQDERPHHADERPRPAPAPAPRQRRRWYWSDPEPETGTSTGTGTGTGTDESDYFNPEPEEPYRFSKLREDAWEHWLIDSEPLAAAHRTGHATRNRRTAIDRECGPTISVFIRLIQWIVAVLKGPDPNNRPADTAGAAEPPATPVNVSELETRVRPHPAPSPQPRPLPRTGNGFIGSWELQFDARHTATGGGLA